MCKILRRVVELVEVGEVRISAHGYDEIAADGISVREVVAGATEAVLVEDYPDYPKGPCCLVVQRDATGRPVHAVWGLARNTTGPAVLVTAYRPDPKRWSSDFTRRLR